MTVNVVVILESTLADSPPKTLYSCAAAEG
jgi:hypothetical protein